MTQKIGIGIQAQFDTSSVEAQLNALGQKIAAMNKMQFTPFSKTSQSDVEKMVKQFDQLLKIHGSLAKRIKDTGQSGKGLFDLDWDSLYSDPTTRARSMRKAFEYTTGTRFIGSPMPAQPTTPPAAPPAPAHAAPGAGSGGSGSPWASVGMQVAQAGMRAAGPAGSVAAGAMGTGAASGFGAGLMGLMGGMLALGASKVVGSAMEKLSEAEDNAVALDRLKRVLGDVNVAFDALKTVVHTGADNMRITYAESERLSTQFAKLGNLSSEQYTSLSEELAVTVGTGRAFGLDPSQTTGVLGQMRGVGVTQNTQDTRRFALLIGETIGRAGAFAKADEVMEAIAGFAASQTRSNLSRANAEGYAGTFSAMVKSGIPGLDPQGAAGILGRVNSSLAAGGANGEASQFFTAMVGARMGLDPIQTQILREGGAFATKDGVFGRDSVYKRYMGQEGPAGDQTVLQSTLDLLKQQRFATDERQDKLLRAQAAANHLGVNVSQAMALLSVQPNAMGEMQDKFGDLSKFSASGIGNISKALYGSADERQALAESFLARTGDNRLSDADATAVRNAQGNDAQLKEVLARVAAKYGQEETTGTAIRDSKNLLDNIKTSIADRLVPISQDIRSGILWMAGGYGKTSQEELLKKIAESESKTRVGNIKSAAQNEREGLKAEYEKKKNAVAPDPAPFAIQNEKWWQEAAAKIKAGTMTADEKKDFEARVKDHEARRIKGLTDPATAAEKRRLDEELARKLKAAEDAEKDRLAKEAERLRKELEGVRKAEAARLDMLDASANPNAAGRTPASASGVPLPTGVAPVASGDQSAAETARLSRRATRAQPSPGAGAGGSALASSLSDIPDEGKRRNVAAMLDAIAEMEGAGYRTLVGQGKNNEVISDLSAHPNVVGMVTADGPSTAAGRYQITNTTWRSVAGKLGLKDFSPESQDRAAIELLRRRGALEDVMNGDFEAAAKKLGKEWQGLPSGESPNQGRRSWSEFHTALQRSLKSQRMPAAAGAAAPVARPPAAEVAKPAAGRLPTSATLQAPPVTARSLSQMPRGRDPSWQGEPSGAYQGWKREIAATPLPSEQDPVFGGLSAAPRATPLSGEMSLHLDLSPDAKRLLLQPSAPISGRVGPASPFGTLSNW